MFGYYASWVGGGGGVKPNCSVVRLRLCLDCDNWNVQQKLSGPKVLSRSGYGYDRQFRATFFIISYHNNNHRQLGESSSLFMSSFSYSCTIIGKLKLPLTQQEEELTPKIYQVEVPCRLERRCPGNTEYCQKGTNSYNI